MLELQDSSLDLKFLARMQLNCSQRASWLHQTCHCRPAPEKYPCLAWAPAFSAIERFTVCVAAHAFFRSKTAFRKQRTIGATLCLWPLLASELVGRRPAPNASLTCQMLELQHVMLNLNLSVRDIILFPSLFCSHPAAQKAGMLLCWCRSHSCEDRQSG